MTKYSRFLSAALLSASLAVVGISAAQAESAGDHQPDDGKAGSPLVAYRVIKTVNTPSGMDIIYSNEALPVTAIGPRDVSEQAMTAAAYGLKPALPAAQQLAETPK
ncbi:hypothetical protein [Insolitispirillum peregrinum]|uniref:Uncharacterized protein n=1 Tax=Insolitispirillum peregrinum TaxID=80876 RepID=A0A1N7LM01_9PROT|nr:hypothetical protein [Insolitispirillum peregrinum]SIS74873.1 hypothetical protein SAMN05421779_103416 [Insolitispirillum peregrinum]